MERKESGSSVPHEIPLDADVFEQGGDALGEEKIFAPSAQHICRKK